MTVKHFVISFDKWFDYVDHFRTFLTGTLVSQCLYSPPQAVQATYWLNVSSVLTFEKHFMCKERILRLESHTMSYSSRHHATHSLENRN